MYTSIINGKDMFYDRFVGRGLLKGTLLTNVTLVTTYRLQVIQCIGSTIQPATPVLLLLLPPVIHVAGPLYISDLENWYKNKIYRYMAHDSTTYASDNVSTINYQ